MRMDSNSAKCNNQMNFWTLPGADNERRKKESLIFCTIPNPKSPISLSSSTDGVREKSCSQHKAANEHNKKHKKKFVGFVSQNFVVNEQYMQSSKDQQSHRVSSISM